MLRTKKMPSRAIFPNDFILDCGITAVDGEDGAGDVAGFVGGQEDDGGIEFAGLAVALHGDVGFSERLELVGVENGFGEFGFEVAGTNRIDSNAIGGEFGGDGASEVDDGALAGVVGDGVNFSIADQAVHAGDVDNAAVVVFLHDFGKSTGHFENRGFVGGDGKIPLFVGHIDDAFVFGGAGAV